MKPTCAGLTVTIKESTILGEARIYLGTLPGAMFIRINTGVYRAMWSKGVVRSAPNGTADLLGAYCGYAVAAEAKTTKGKQTKDQRNFQIAWEKAGGVYILFTSVDDLAWALSDLRSRNS